MVVEGEPCFPPFLSSGRIIFPSFFWSPNIFSGIIQVKYGNKEKLKEDTKNMVSWPWKLASKSYYNWWSIPHNLHTLKTKYCREYGNQWKKVKEKTGISIVETLSFTHVHNAFNIVFQQKKKHLWIYQKRMI